MTRQEITDQVDKYIFQSITYKGEIESNKLEFKGRKWYDLKSDEVFTCARHITGIANSLGGGDGFLIFGYELKTQLFIATSMSDSGFNDPAEIFGVINRRISNNVSFEVIDHQYQGNSISIVHILPSLSKPHILPFYKDIKTNREFKHVTFIRNGVKTDLATKEDFERMYSDRTNIFVDHKLILTINKKLVSFNLGGVKDLLKFPIILNLECTFENYGIRNLRVGKITLDLEVPEDYRNSFKSNTISFASSMLSSYKGANTPSISPNESYQRKIVFLSEITQRNVRLSEFSSRFSARIDQPSKFEFSNIRVWLYSGVEIMPEIILTDFV